MTAKDTAIGLAGAGILYVVHLPMLYAGNAIVAFLIYGFQQVTR